MLLKISKQEAFKRLLNEETSKKIFVKTSNSYRQAVTASWCFGDRSNSTLYAHEDYEFFEEVEETLKDDELVYAFEKD